MLKFCRTDGKIMTEPVSKNSGDSAPSDEVMLVAFLSEREERCPVCRYNLRGLTHPRCPECGQALRLTVGTVDAYSRAWVTTVAALCAAAGVGIICLFVIVVDGWPYFSGFWLNFCLSVPLASIPASLCAIFLRRKFLRLPRGWQWLIAVVGILLVPLNTVLLLVLG